MDEKKINKVIVIIISIVVAIALITATIFCIKYISENNKIKQTNNKLSQIDTKELEDKLIKELIKSQLYLEIDGGDIFVGTMFNDGIVFNNYTCLTYVCIKNGNVIAAVEIPAFKITSDENGKFKSIEYSLRTAGVTVIPNVVKKVFKDNYDVDIKIPGNSKYNNTFNYDIDGYTNQGNIYIIDENFYLGILGKTTNKSYNYGEKVPNDLKQYQTQTFGIKK